MDGSKLTVPGLARQQASQQVSHPMRRPGMRRIGRRVPCRPALLGLHPKYRRPLAGPPGSPQTAPNRPANLLPNQGCRQKIRCKDRAIE
jgi:hypothetical protein